MSKFGARKVTIDGITFDSKAEAARYQELRLLERAGDIRELKVHSPVYPLEVNGVKVSRYTPDFTYVEVLASGGPRLVVEDVKGVKTRDYVMRRKLMKALYGIEITEVAA